MPMSNEDATYSNDQGAVADICNIGGAHGAVAVGLTAVEAKAGATKLTGRKVIIIQPTTTGVYLGMNNTVTSATGMPLMKNQTLIFPVGDGLSMWLISTIAGGSVRIIEAG
jgi:hypothetical protein